MTRLAGLPSELNKKMDWRLKRPIANSMMLTLLPVGGGGGDGGDGGGDGNAEDGTGGSSLYPGMSASASLAMAVARDEEGGEGKEGGAGGDKAPMAADKRWDSGEGKMDSGIKLTCVYLLGVGKDGGDGGSWNTSCGGATRCVSVLACVGVCVGVCGFVWVGGSKTLLAGCAAYLGCKC